LLATPSILPLLLSNKMKKEIKEPVKIQWLLEAHHLRMHIIGENMGRNK
jgi:hypothetical protein